MLVHVLQCSEMLRELFLRMWKIDRSKIFPRYARKKNSRPLRGLYIWPLHSLGPSDALETVTESASDLQPDRKPACNDHDVKGEGQNSALRAYRYSDPKLCVFAVYV